MIALSPTDQQSKIRIYKDEDGACKGDALLCYNAQESVTLAMEILNGGFIRPNKQITIVRADFSTLPSIDSTQTHANSDSSHGGVNGAKRARVSVTAAQRKVAQSAMRQALAWNEDDDSGVARSAALRIVVLEGMFSLEDFAEPSFAAELEEDVASECGKCGELDKITLFSENPKGVVIVKFKTGFAAQECVRLMDGRFFASRRLRCYFWDGSTNFSVTSTSGEDEDAREQHRLESFGDWLDKEQEQLPDEFQLLVEK